MPLLPELALRKSLECFQKSRAHARLRRLFLEPLEDRRMLTFGWGSSTASGSYTGQGTSWGWGEGNSLASHSWPNSDSDGDGVLDTGHIAFYAQLFGWPFAEGTTATLRIDTYAYENWAPSSVAVECKVEGLSAEAGTDFSTPSGSWTEWQLCGAPLGSFAEIPIVISQDSEAELNESVRIRLRSPYDVFSPGEPELELVIQGGTAQFSAEAVAATEGSDLLLNVTSNIALPFEYRVENYSANAGADYSGPSEWTPLDASGQAIFPAVDDSEYEGTESFRLLVRVANEPSTEMPLEADIFDNDGPNVAPVANDDSLTTAEDTALTVNAPGILGNDTDANGNVLTAYFATGPTHGVVTLYSNGNFTYMPDANYMGPDSFTYRASDGLELSNVATVAINVSGVSDAPIAASNNYSLAGNTSLSTPAPGVLSGDTDGDGDTLTALVVANPAHGTLTLQPNGSFTYTPTIGYAGTDSFTYRASDGQLTSNIATVTLTVIGVNPPAAVANSYQAYKNTPLTIAAPGLLANDSDPDGDALTAALVEGAAHGTVVVSGNGGFTYTPAANYVGADSFTYRAFDGYAHSNTVTVTLNVVEPPDIDVERFYADGTDFKLDYRVTGAVASGYTITLYASPDGVTPDVALQSVPGETNPGNHTLTLTPAFADPFGDHYFMIQLDSGHLIAETSELNNSYIFEFGAFVLTEPDGRKVLHVHGSDAADSIRLNVPTTGAGALAQLIYGGNPYANYNWDQLGAILFRGHDGNDSLAVDEVITRQTWMYGGEGDDWLSGGGENDYLFGGDGNDQLSGNAGNDNLFGDGGHDSLRGGAGNDSLTGSGGEDNLYGNEGADGLIGGEGNDTLSGGADNDVLLGDSGSDNLFGDSGEDNLDGEAGNDTLRGGAGNDTLNGGDGNDTLGGDAGNDDLDGDLGDDSMYGGDGEGDSNGDTDGNNSFDPSGSPLGDPTAPIEVYIDGSAVGSEGHDAIIELNAYSEEDDSVQVTVDVWDGTAHLGADYGGSSSYTVTIETGPLEATTAQIRIPIIYDDVYPEPDETFYYQITNIVGGFTRQTQPMIVTIGDGTMVARDDVAITSMDIPVEVPVRENDWFHAQIYHDQSDLEGLGCGGRNNHCPILTYTQPAHGTVSHWYENTWIFADMEPVYTPDPGFYGDDEFDYTISYEHIEDYSVNSANCTGCTETAHVFVNVRKIDLDNDADGDGQITEADDPLEMSHAQISLNLDDDNENEIPDWEEAGPVIGEDDLQEIKITAALSAARPELYEGWKLRLTFPEPNFGKLWATPDKTDQLIGTGAYGNIKEWIVGQDELPNSFYLEAGPANLPGDHLGLRLEFLHPGASGGGGGPGPDVDLIQFEAVEGDLPPITLLDSIIYGWEGDGLNAYIKATTRLGHITVFEVDVDQNGTYDFALGDYQEVIKGSVESGLPGMHLLSSQDDGTYPAKLRITNSLGTETEFDVEIVVINAPTLIEFGENDVVGDPGVPFTLNVTTSDPGPDTVSQIVIAWGDGSTSTISGSSGASSHTYAAAGNYVIRATATDEDGSLWAEHEVQIGDIEPFADPGEPTITSAFSVILANDNAQLTIEAEDSSGSSSGLTYDWDLDGDGIFETPSGSTIELSPTTNFHRYSAAVKITDSQGRSIDALFGFTQAGAQMPGPQTAPQGTDAFKKVTPLPAGTGTKWNVHHTKQARLAKRYWDERGINVHMEEYLRAVPEDVHVQHITPQQNAWWRKKAQALGVNVADVYDDVRVTLAEVEIFEAELNGQFNRFWVPARANAQDIMKAANEAREQRFILQITKASRWKNAGIIAGTLPVFMLLTSKAQAFQNMQNFDRNHASFGIFVDKYEDCLNQAMGPAGKPSKEAAEQLVDLMHDFAIDISPKDAEQINLSRKAAQAVVTKMYVIGQ